MSIDLIFKQLDKYNIGELNKDEFKSAFKKIGIDLQEFELRLLKEKLDLRNNDKYEYTDLLKVLRGVPIKLFLPQSMQKMAELVLSRDHDKNDLRRIIANSEKTESLSIS